MCLHWEEGKQTKSMIPKNFLLNKAINLYIIIFIVKCWNKKDVVDVIVLKCITLRDYYYFLMKFDIKCLFKIVLLPASSLLAEIVYLPLLIALTVPPVKTGFIKKSGIKKRNEYSYKLIVLMVMPSLGFDRKCIFSNQF